MNAKKLLISLVLLVGLIVLTSPATFAQRAWYVNNSAIGNDGRDGSSPTIPNPDDFVTGPKKTLGGVIPSPGAIAAATAGDTIYVANTGVAYGVATGEPATIIVNKKLVIRSTGGAAPSISSLVEINNAAASPNNVVIFDSGEFTLSGGMTLTAGVLTNSANLLTVSGTITRSIAAATVGSQLKYTGTVDFVYAGGAAITAGNEFPATGSFRNLTTTGAGTNLTLKTTSASMTGVITTTGAGTLNLGGNVLTITNTGAAVHALGGGNVTNGTLAFSLGGGDATINGAVAIPSVTVSTSTADARTLAVAQPTSITGPLTVSGKASVTSSAALVTVGAASFTGDEVVLSGTGNVTLSGAPTTVNGNVVNSGTGILTMTNATATTVNGNLLLNTTGLNTTNTGQIVFASSAAVVVNGNVTNSAGIVLGKDAAVDHAGVIWFPAVATTVTGVVKLDAGITGTAKASDNYTINGLIYFGATTADVILGSVINDSRMTATGIAGATVVQNGQIWFLSTSGNVVATGGIVNSSSMAKLALGTNTDNGLILWNARTTGTIGTSSSRTGTISNTSVSDEPTNGQIDFLASATGTLYGTSISQGALGAGGDIEFGNHVINLTGNITNARTATGSDITVPAGAATVTNSIGGYILNSGKSNISIDLTGNDIIGITGRVENSGDGTIGFPNAGSGAITMGGLVVSKGLVSIPNTNDATLAINGAVNISGGEASLLANGGDAIVITGPASFTGGAFTTTGRTTVTTNSTSITIGGASSNTTFSTAATAIVIGNPSPTSLVTVTIGTFNPTIAGVLEVNNTTGLAEAVRFTGGSMTVSGNLLFTSGAIVIADNANISVVGTFTNAAGYTTPTIGRVTLAGTGAQTFGGAGTFGNIEFKNVAGMSTTTPVTLISTIYLTSGVVTHTNPGTLITIDNTTVLPTVVLNAGSFSLTPNYNSNVNITYIGSDKTTGNEMPALATKLQNLTVATTNGASAGKGIVKISANTTVNGILTVNSLQALNIDNGFTLTMKGASIVLTGDIINVGTGKLSLAAATGTTIAGAGYLPPIEIAAASVGNVIGAKAIINQLLGTDGIYGGAADFAPTTGTAQGSLTYITGTNSATITLTGITDGSMVGAVTTAGTGNTLNLGGNLVVAGALTHAAGTINVGAFTLEQRGAAITLGASTVPATFTGTGLLKFYQKDATTNTSFTLTSAATVEGSLIGINTELNNADATGAEDNLVLAGGPLTISGSLTITDGELVLGQNLTLTGSAATITTNGTVSGTGVLTLNAATPPLVFTYTGAPTISNLTIRNDVNLAGTGTGLTISTAFNHVAGILNFGNMNLTFQTAFTRTAGTAAYQAGSGYMILDGAVAVTIAQGTDGFSVPNLRITSSGAADVALTTAQGTVTVTKAFDLETAANTFTTNGKLAIANQAIVSYTSGAISASPAYAGSISLIGKNYANSAVFPANLWPATVNVTTLGITNTSGGNIISLPAARTVTKELLLTSGVLDMSATAQVLTVSDSSTINVIAGLLTKSVGSIVFGNNNNVNYKTNGKYNANVELPGIVNNLTFTRNSNAVNSADTIRHSVTVNGTLTIKDDVTIPPAPPAIVVTANGNVAIVSDAANFALATTPVAIFNQSMVFGGGNATLTVPNLAPPLNFGAITISKTTADNTLTLVGGNIATGIITFTMGDIVTGNNVLYIPAPTTGAVAGGAVSQGFIGAGPNSMVVGNVAKALINNGTINGSTEADNQFPVGTGLVYRPAILSFNANFGVPTTPNATIVVGHVDQNPGGSQALPIVNGVEAGVDIARYPSFYWSIYTIGQVSPSTEFDLGLTAGNYTDFDSPANVRIIRRHGAVADVNNDWLLQGTNTNYDNEVNAQTGFTAINRNSVAGLRTGGAVFTYGLKSRIVAQTLPDITIGKVGTAWPARRIPLAGVFSNYVGTLTYSISSTNTSVANGVVSHDTLIVTAIKLGDATITIKATDSNLDFTTSSFKVEATATGVIVTPLPKVFALKQNYPNPFNPTTNISFDIPQNSSVKIVIYDMLGREVSTLVNANYAAGTYTVPFNASRLSSGMYIYRMTSQSVNGETFNSIKKLMLVK